MKVNREFFSCWYDYRVPRWISPVNYCTKMKFLVENFGGMIQFRNNINQSIERMNKNIDQKTMLPCIHSFLLDTEGKHLSNLVYVTWIRSKYNSWTGKSPPNGQTNLTVTFKVHCNIQFSFSKNATINHSQNEKQHICIVSSCRVFILLSLTGTCSTSVSVNSLVQITVNLWQHLDRVVVIVTHWFEFNIGNDLYLLTVLFHSK